MTRHLVILFTGITLVLLPGSAKSAPATQPTIEQKTALLFEKWKVRFAEEKFNAIEAPPFLIAGNGTRQQLAQYRDGTILPSAKALAAQYFKTPPNEPVLILLFESERPYKQLAKKWFNDNDVPHFGFYSHHNRTMMMNVSTGLGTLVHEMTHALIAPDFPKVPDWFNEGLASLYEQSRFSPDGESITGLPNWRLPALQREIQNETVRPLAELIQDDDFRNSEKVGINYAQARYLMLFLQEKGLLRQYYAQFRQNNKVDPTGLETLKKIVAPRTWEQFEAEWQKWVMSLKSP